MVRLGVGGLVTCKNAIEFNHHGGRRRHTVAMGPHSRQQIIQQSTNMLTWNIRSAQGAGLAAAVKCLHQMGVGCCVVSGHHVISSKAMRPQQGGVALLWEEGHQDFEVEAVTIASLNLLTFQLVTGEARYFMMGAYIPPLTRQGWMTSALPGLPAPPTVNCCCWGI